MIKARRHKCSCKGYTRSLLKQVAELIPWRDGGPHRTWTASWHFPGSASLPQLESFPLWDTTWQIRHRGAGQAKKDFMLSNKCAHA